MDHVVYLDAESEELQNLIEGKKSMIIRGSAEKAVPHGLVNTGDVLYFLNNVGESEVRAMGVVSSVINTDKLSEEESFKTVIRYQDKLQLPDTRFYKIAGKRYLVLVGLDKIQILKPFHLDLSSFNSDVDWLPVGNIQMVALNASVA